jgi:RHS repeat-associated protein
MNIQGHGFYYARNRYYFAPLGRWITRDPNNRDRPGGGYQDGMSLYQYGRSSPTTGADPYGLEWEVERAGEVKAAVVAKGDENGRAVDTMRTLAEKVGLEADQWPTWASPPWSAGWEGKIRTSKGTMTWRDLANPDNAAFHSSEGADVVICQGEQAKVPNTVLAYYADDSELKGFYRWPQDVATLKNRGFHVVEKDNAWNAAQFRDFISRDTEGRRLHGLVFQGHGGYAEEKLPAPDWDLLKVLEGRVKIVWIGIYTIAKDRVRPVPDDGHVNHLPYDDAKKWGRAYKLGLGLMYTCGGTGARHHFADNGIFWGYHDELWPLPGLWPPPVKDMVPPGAQGTKK